MLNALRPVRATFIRDRARPEHTKAEAIVDMKRKLNLLLAAVLCGALAALAAGCKASDGVGGPRASSSLPGSDVPAGATPHATSTPNDGVRRVTVDETQALVAKGEAVVVDVRAKPQYDQSRIKGSLSLPRTEIDQRLAELPKDKLIIFYCA